MHAPDALAGFEQGETAPSNTLLCSATYKSLQAHPVTVSPARGTKYHDFLLSFPVIGINCFS
jgi:hypothetical protein